MFLYFYISIPDSNIPHPLSLLSKKIKAGSTTCARGDCCDATMIGGEGEDGGAGSGGAGKYCLTLAVSHLPPPQLNSQLVETSGEDEERRQISADAGADARNRWKHQQAQTRGWLISERAGENSIVYHSLSYPRSRIIYVMQCDKQLVL